MGRNAPPQSFTQAQLKSLVTRLERVSGRLEAVRTQMEMGDVDRLFIFNAPTMSLAIEYAESFGTEAEKSWDAHESGDPYDENTEKSRFRPSRAAPSNGEKKPRKKRAPKKSAEKEEN